jgi:hypothetical protein
MENPCWKNYMMVGTKTKNGKEVPNCVPKKKAAKKSKDAVRTTKGKGKGTLLRD